MTYRVNVELILDVASDAEAADALNEILRERQRDFAPQSCLIDYRHGEIKRDDSIRLNGYAEGDAWPLPAESTAAPTPTVEVSVPSPTVEGEPLACPKCGNEQGIYARIDLRWNPDAVKWDACPLEQPFDCTECDHEWTPERSSPVHNPPA